MLDFTVIIPARYAASRLPGKLLQLIGDKSVLEHSYTQALQSGASRVIIATDDERIAELMQGRGAEVCMTPLQCASGSERLAWACARLQLDDERIVVNLQGDEPFMPPECINLCARNLAANPDCPVATLAVACPPGTETEPDVVKVVLDNNQRALYFSRAPIPYQRCSGYCQALRHLGIYAYRASFLQRYQQLAPVALEQAEQLEQLRVLAHGYAISVAISTQVPPAGIDNSKDLDAAREYYQRWQRGN